MGITDGRIGCLKICKQFRRGIPFADVAAQHSVDESRLRAKAGIAGELDNDMDGSVMGNAVEPEDLIEAQLKQNAKRRFLRAAISFAGDKPIKRRLLANDTIDQFMT